MKHALAIVLALLLSGCSLNAQPWTPLQKALALTTVACGFGDLVSTVVGREVYEISEGNPWMRNYGVFIPLRLASLPAYYLLGEFTGQRTLVWSLAAPMNCAVVVWNVHVIERRASREEQ